MKRILCIGWFNRSNCGDELYKIAFPRLFPGFDFRFVDKIRATDIQWCDVIVLGGGNILDHVFLDSVNLMNLGDKPLYAWSVGCTDKSVTKEHFRKFKRIWVRDRRSQNSLGGLGVISECAPDAAWIMEADPKKGLSKWEEVFRGRDLYQKRVAVTLNAHLTSLQPDLLARDAFRWQTICSDLVRLLDDTYASFAFVPFGTSMPWDDRVPNSWVAHKCKWHHKNAVIYDQWDVQNTLDFVAAADVLISMRYHSSVFGIVTGVPFIDIHHHDKNRGLLDFYGLNDWGVSYWDFSLHRCRFLLDDHLASRDKHHGMLESKTIQIKKELQDFCKSLKSEMTWTP